MRKLRPLAMIILIAGAIWYGIRYLLPVGVSKDFSLICTAYEHGLARIRAAESRSESPDRPQIAYDIAAEIERDVVNKDVKKALGAISRAIPESQYVLLQSVASELGVANWTCDAAQLYLNRDRIIN